MRVAVFLTLADAQDYADQLDPLFGYPSDGQNVGDGAHVGRLVGQTRRFARVFRHPRLARFAVIHSAAVETVIGTAPDATPAQINDPRAVLARLRLAKGTLLERDPTWDDDPDP